MRRLSLSVRELELEIEKYTSTVEVEAHSLVREANAKTSAAEKALKESQMEVEVLQAEVNALKQLLVTTPSKSPQIGIRLFPKSNHSTDQEAKQQILESQSQVDPVFFNEFSAWRQNPQLCRSPGFMKRLFREDVDICLDFPNVTLSLRLKDSVEQNFVYVEEIPEMVDRCSLLDCTGTCKYRMRLSDKNEWHLISQLCRNRITAVCDLFSYLRYIQQGLVKSSLQESYWNIIKLRKQIKLATLGLKS